MAEERSAGRAGERIGLVGLGVMGANLGLNLAGRGFALAVHDTDAEAAARFAAAAPAGADVRACADLAALAGALERPRRVIVLVPAGGPTDAVLDALAGHLEPGDAVAECGNSHFADTERRVEAFAARGLHLAGCGISGGAEGARRGPSVMPGGDPGAWQRLAPVLRAIAARVDGEPACEWLGPGGAGHFVKTLHNGIEYGELQLLAEAYDLLGPAGGREAFEVAALLRAWTDGPLAGFLLETAAGVLARPDEAGGALVDRVRDAVGQKGTGRWSVEAALALGEPATLAAEAVLARALAGHEALRAAARVALGSAPDVAPVRIEPGRVEAALLGARIVGHAQGFLVLAAASRERGWALDLARVARVWRGGCIIRSRVMDRIERAWRARPDLECLVLDPGLAREVRGVEPAWREVAGVAVGAGVPVPALSSGLAFLDGLRRERLPSALVAAVRDAFGGHGYERIDRPRGEIHHTDWGTGAGSGSGPGPVD